MNLVDIILKHGNKLRKTRSGKPYCSALSSIAERRVSAEERDEAWRDVGDAMSPKEAAPAIRDPEEEWIMTLTPAAAKHARKGLVPMQPGYDAAKKYAARYVRVRIRPANVPGGQRGAFYSPELIPGDKCFYARRDYGTCEFLRWDGACAVLKSGKEWLSPDAPPDIPRLGAAPAGARFSTSPRNILIRRMPG